MKIVEAHNVRLYNRNIMVYGKMCLKYDFRTIK